MTDIKDVPNSLSKQAAKEQTFRKQITAGIIQLLRDPKTDPALRLITLLCLVVLAGVSFVFSALLVHAIYAGTIGDTNFNPLKYGYIIFALFALLMALAIPAVFRASPTEQALRLGDNYSRTYSGKIGKLWGDH